MKAKRILLGLLVGVFLNFVTTQSQTKLIDNINLDFSKTQATQISSIEKLDVNNISGIFYNNGEFYSNSKVRGPGFEWIKGNNKFAIFSAGIWIGAYYRESDRTNDVRVAYAMHFNSLYQPGKINPLTGIADDPDESRYKIYKVQPLIDNPLTNPDLLNWPIDQGAPWIDIDNDGKFNPYVDKVGIKLHNGYTIPDMVLFSVFNHSKSLNWFLPLNAEVRQTAWAYTSIPNVHFIRFQIYNRSKNYWDSTFIGLWSDPDLGYAYDDYAGVDIRNDQNGKSHQLGYCYNGNDYDSQYGTNPPAVGFKLLQGPAVLGNPNDSATYFGQKLYGYKNLEMSSFLFYCHSGQNCDPKYSINPFHPYNYYLLLKGKRVQSEWFKKTETCDPSFEVPGDPVSDTSCIMANLLPPTDIRYLMNIGPLTIAPGDSQDLIYAALIEQGTDRLNSITKLRKTSSELRYLFDNGLHRVLNKVETEYKFVSHDSVHIKLMTYSKDASTINAKLYRKYDNFELNIELLDDGINDDGIANNKIFGRIINLEPHPVPLDLSLSVRYLDNTNIVFDPIKKITVAGKMSIYSLNVIRENLIPDKGFNPGEVAKCIFSIHNQTKYNLGNFTIRILPLDRNIFKSGELQSCNFRSFLNMNEVKFVDSSEQITFEINPNVPDHSTAKIEFYIVDTLGNSWTDTLSVSINKNLFPTKELYSDLSSGEAEGAFGLRIIYPNQIKNNFYNIEIKKQIDKYKFNLINTFTNDTLLYYHDLPDSLGLNMPVVDGFRLTQGSITTKTGLKKWNYYPYENIWFTGVFGLVADLSLKFGRGLIAYPTLNNFIYQKSALPIDSLKYVEIHFDRKNTQKAYRYITGFRPFPSYMRLVRHPEFRPFVKDSSGSVGWIFQDYEKYRLGVVDSGYVVPFTVWQVDIKGNKIRQLDVAIVERNDSLYRWKKISATDSIKEFLYYGNIDGRWNPSPELMINNNPIPGRNGDEYIIIFNSTYSETPKTEYCVKQLDEEFPKLPVMYAVVMRRLNVESDFKDGDVLKIFPYYPVREGVVYSFNPVKLKEEVIPSSFRLSQNYPNPFNAGTTIQYGMHKPGEVQLEIYNILGQKVKTLIENQSHVEGNYEIFWDGYGNNNKPVASGIYFYMIQIKSMDEIFVQVKKMVVVR